MTSPRPLVVDLDGSLLRTDSLHESIATHLRHPPRLAAATGALVSGGRAAFKRSLADSGLPDLADAPLNPAVVALIDERTRDGGTVLIATGADTALASSLVARVPGLDGVVGSDGSVNLTGPRKARILVERFGEGGFDYVGNSTTDIPVWEVADRSFLATTRSRGVPRWATEREFDAVLRDPRPPTWRVWAKALRVHQSLKNLLLFLPLIAAHAFTDPVLLGRAAIGFVVFTLMASAVYLINDTLDMASDRSHPTKRRRPIAAGWVSPLTAIGVAATLIIASIATGTILGPGFLAVLVGYAVLTTAYSFWLKRVAMVDIVVLALLYMVRIVAGAIAAGIVLSFWFTGVTLFLFLSLALVKRYAEAHEARESGRVIRGRGYSADDVYAILALGASAGIASVLLLAIYINSGAVSDLYDAPVVLWLAIPVYFYFIAHLWLKAGRGEVHEDPLIFALRDPASLVSGAIILVLFFVASVPAVGDLVGAVGT